MIDYGKRLVLDVPVDAVDLEFAVERILYYARLRRPYAVTALAVHGVVEAASDESLRRALEDFDLILPDGQPVRWAINFLHHLDLPDKVPGPTVVDQLLAAAADERIPVFFYGSTPDALARIRSVLAARFGNRLTVETAPSRFGKVARTDVPGIAASINETGAGLCFVGLGCPRQERFVSAIGPHIDMPSLAVGAAFDYIAGTIQRAAPTVQRIGLEWAYRLVQDPRRLVGRYARTNLAFLVGIARQAAPGRHEPQRPQVADVEDDLVDA